VTGADGRISLFVEAGSGYAVPFTKTDMRLADAMNFSFFPFPFSFLILPL